MKKSILYILFILFTLIGCQHDHDHGDHSGHDHEEHHDHDEVNFTNARGNKIIALNQRQYEFTGIQLGKYSLKNINEILEVNGYTRLDPSNEANISMPISGTITNVNVIEGDAVTQGQTLATMKSLAFNELLHEQVKLDNQKQAVYANLDFLKKDMERHQKLVSLDAMAKKKFEKAEADYKVQQAKLTAIDREAAVIQNATSMIGTGSSNEIAITAPISGYVTDIHTRIGSSIQQGENLFEIVNTKDMHLDLMVYERDINKIKLGQQVRFSLANQTTEEITAKIYNIGKTFKNETKSIMVHADISGGKNLISGMFVNALIDVGKGSKVKAVPETAIVQAEGRHFVFGFLEPGKDKSQDDHGHGHDDDHGHDDHAHDDHVHDTAKDDGHAHDDHAGHEHGDDEHAHDDHGHDHGSHDDHNPHEQEYVFERLEVLPGKTKLGYTAVRFLSIPTDEEKLVLEGAYYLQSHLQKSEGAGGHGHAH